MLHWLIGGGILWSMFGPKREEGASPVADADPYAVHCPVDASLPPQGVAAVRACWMRGTKDELEAFAAQLGTAFPIARSSLLGRAYELHIAATRATQGAGMGAGAKVRPAAPAAQGAAPAPGEAEAEEKPAPTRKATKAEIAHAEGLAAVKASEQNGKGKIVAIDVPAEVIDTVGEVVGQG